MMPTTIKGLIAYILSLEYVLAITIIWLQDLNQWFSDVSSIILAIAGVIIAYYTIKRLKLDIRARKLDNAIKEIDLEEKIENKKKNNA